MSVISWTSEGMDWSSADSVRQMPLLPCFEAIRKACAERLLAIMNAALLASGSSSPATGESLDSSDVYGGLFGSSASIEVMPTKTFCAFFQSAMDFLLQSKFLDSSKLNSPSFDAPTEITAAKIEASSSYSGLAFASLPKLIEASAVSLIGADFRIAPEPLSTIPEWLHQQYLLLNLMDSAIISPPSSIISGGQRYFVELAPWDSEDGSYARLALGWAGLTNFSVSEFDAQGWNYKVSANGTKASAFGSTDILSNWTRKQAWREWSKRSFAFALLKAAGLDFELKAMQAETELSNGINEAIPRVSTEFSTELFPRSGYSALSIASQPGEAGAMELEIGNSDAMPEIPSAPESGSNVKGWSLKSLGPFVAQFAFEFKAN